MATSIRPEKELSKASQMPKRLFILCDGTWQDSINGRSRPTNVTTFARCLEHISTDGYLQLTYYDSGIGNGTSWIGQIVDGMTGRGISAKIRNAYSFLSRNYNFDRDSRPDKKTDEIVLVGYSRGAFAVQCVASLLDCIGLLKANELYYLQGLFDLWANRELKPMFRKDDASGDTSKSLLDRRVEFFKKKDASREVRVKALLVWDTVSALGIPVHFNHRPLSFVGTEVPAIVDNAFQALSLDEARAVFTPQVWESKKGETCAKQCWFKGAHVDVGGNGDAELGAITLLWMIGQVTKRTGISFRKEEIRRHLQLRHLDWKVHIGWLGCAYDTAEISPLPGTGSASPLSWYWWAFQRAPRKPYSSGKQGPSEDTSLKVKTKVHSTSRMPTEEPPLSEAQAQRSPLLGLWNADKKAWELGNNIIKEARLRSKKYGPQNGKQDEMYWLNVWLGVEDNDETVIATAIGKEKKEKAVIEDDKTAAIGKENKGKAAIKREKRAAIGRGAAGEKLPARKGRASTRGQLVKHVKSDDSMYLKGGETTGKPETRPKETAEQQEHKTKEAEGVVKDDDEEEIEFEQGVQDENSVKVLILFLKDLERFLRGSEE